jgi:hypothetical protein
MERILWGQTFKISKGMINWILTAQGHNLVPIYKAPYLRMEMCIHGSGFAISIIKSELKIFTRTRLELDQV